MGDTVIYVAQDGRTARFDGRQLGGLYHPSVVARKDIPAARQQIHLNGGRPIDQCCRDCRQKFNIMEEAARCIHWTMRARNGNGHKA